MKHVKTIAAFILCTVLLVPSCTPQVSSAPELRDTVKVSFDTAVVERGDVARISQLECYVRAAVEDVKFEGSSGVFYRSYVIVGQKVKAGELVASLDTGSLDSGIDAATDEIERLKRALKSDSRLKEIEIELAQLDLADARDAGNDAQIKLCALNVSKLESELMRIEDTAAIDIVQAQSGLKDLETRRAAMQIFAPCDGEVVYVSPYNEGNWVSRGTVAVRIAAYDSAYIQYDGGDRSFGLLDGKTITAMIDGTSYDLEPFTYDEREYIDLVLAGKTPPPRFSFVDDVPFELVGAFAAVTVVNSVASDVLRIPSGALYIADGKYYVYRIEGHDKVYTEISLGARNAAWIEVTAGLEEGDVVNVKQ